MSETTTCYRESTNGVYFTRNAHRTDCTDPDCRGCRVCPADGHCTARRNCSWHIAEGELTCGRCLASTRRDLLWVGALAALLLPAAITDGLGSEAANLAGPTADPEAWTWRKVTAARTVPWEALEDDDEHHPHAVVGVWARMLTEDYGHDMPEQASLSWCVAYVDRTLARVAHDGRQDFPLLARELKKCRQHVEAVLHNDSKPERGAPCPECTSPDGGLGPRLRREYAHWCDDEDCERMHYDDDEADMWVCPRIREHRWSHYDYERWTENRRAGRMGV